MLIHAEPVSDVEAPLPAASIARLIVVRVAFASIVVAFGISDHRLDRVSRGADDYGREEDRDPLNVEQVTLRSDHANG
jgi:hypothetical protein